MGIEESGRADATLARERGQPCQQGRDPLGRQGARQAAASALAGFAFLVFAVVGIGIVS